MTWVSPFAPIDVFDVYLLALLLICLVIYDIYLNIQTMNQLKDLQAVVEDDSN